MNNKLQELTDKIYTEGLEKGKKEAEEIITEANSQAKQIIEQAHKKAREIETAASKKAENLEKNSKSEISLFAKRSVDSLRSEITNLISRRIVEESVSEAFKEKDFLQKIILSISQEITKNEPVTIQVSDKEPLINFFKAKAAELLDNNLEIKQVNGLKTDFVIVSEKGGYKIKVGEEAFIQYFKQFLRPEMIKILFER